MIRKIMRILKNKQFHHWAKEEGVSDRAILLAMKEMEKGLYEANLLRCSHEKINYRSSP
jgi:hypothetical protein